MQLFFYLWSVLTVCVVAAPPLSSVEGMVKALESLTQQWKDVSACLYIPRVVVDQIASDCSTDKECFRTVIQYWLLRDPYASWRRIIHVLDRKKEEAFIKIADTLKKNSEPLEGICCIRGQLPYKGLKEKNFCSPRSRKSVP